MVCSPRLAAAAPFVVAVGLVLAGCGGDDPGGVPISPSDTQSAPAQASKPPGTATLTYPGGAPTFTFTTCISTGDTSIEAEGENPEHVITINIDNGVGDVITAPKADLAATMDGVASEVAVSADGTFDVSGSFLTADGQAAFMVTGTCGSLDW